MSESLILSWGLWPLDEYPVGPGWDTAKELWLRRLHDASPEQLGLAYTQWTGDEVDLAEPSTEEHDDWKAATMDYLSEGIEYLSQGPSDTTLMRVGKNRWAILAGGSSYPDPSEGFTYLCALSEADVVEPIYNGLDG